MLCSHRIIPIYSTINPLNHCNPLYPSLDPTQTTPNLFLDSLYSIALDPLHNPPLEPSYYFSLDPTLQARHFMTKVEGLTVIYPWYIKLS